MWLYYLCNRNKWYETQIFHGGSKFHSVQWSLNSWPFAGKSGTGQCTHCRGGAESVLTLSPTVIGVGLHRLGANLTRRKGKYTSASPRWTSTWPRWTWPQCTCAAPRATSAQGHLVQVQVQLGCASLNLDLDSVALSGVNAGPPRATSVKSISAKLKSNSASPRWTSIWPRWTWLESVVDHLVQLQWSPISVQLKSNSASPRWSWGPEGH